VKNPERDFEDRIKLGRDVVVGVVLSLTMCVFTAAGAWHAMILGDEFWTPTSGWLLGIAGLLFLVQLWYFVLREGRTIFMGWAAAVHVVLLLMLPIFIFVSVNEQVLAERGVTESCTVTSQEKIYVKINGERKPRYRHTLECPTGGELGMRTPPSGRYEIGQQVVLTFDPEGRSAHRTGGPSSVPLALFAAISVGIFLLGTLMRFFYLRHRFRRGAKRRAAFGAPGS
jgi:hypothetical protein